MHQPSSTCQGGAPICVNHLTGKFKVSLSNGAQRLKVGAGCMHKLLWHVAAGVSQLGELRDAAACAHDLLEANPWMQISVRLSHHKNESKVAQMSMPAANLDGRSWQSSSLL